MPITPEIDQWLTASGYEYHCFISWAHTRNPDMTQCARRMKEAIEEFLALSVPNPRVFLDEREIRGGDDWEKTLLRALCRSVAMVSLCAPIYYHPSHRWCGLEWATMELLGSKRIPSAAFKVIIPVLIKKDLYLPAVVSEIQYVDFSNIVVRGRRYYGTHDFRRKVMEIGERIEEIATAIWMNRIATDCENLGKPAISPFDNFISNVQSFPFRES